MATQLGIDVGGTFTDLFFIDEASGAIQIAKSPTTHGNLSEGLLRGLGLMGVQPSEIDHLIHGTTIATNAVIERKGSRCGLITTRGFRDVLEMGRRDRPHLYGMFGRQDPLVPRNLRLEVTERLGPDGSVITPLDEDEVAQAAARLEALGVEAVAVCLLHSYANPRHEQRVREIIGARHPGWLVNLSSELLPEIYEFERTSTTVIHTYLQGLLSTYIGGLKGKLAEAGFRKDVFFVQSNGGIVSSAAARDRPANLVLSGPAAGVTAAQFIARQAGFTNVISGDMGGTSFDVCLIPGSAKTTEQKNIAFRQPLRVSMLDVHAIGAGGGSIAHVDDRGLLMVGPESAGSVPGPVAYGRGGAEPTVTDAQVVLGRIGAASRIGADGAMDRDAAVEAIRTRIAEPLGLGVDEAAYAIIQVATTSMAGRIRLISIERGYDPRDFALVAFGGAGPLHAVGLMKDVGIGRCLIPVYPGVLCALGCIAADIQHDFVRTIMKTLPALGADELSGHLRVMEEEGRRLLSRDDVPMQRVDLRIAADMSYEGQRNTIRVTLPADLTAESIREAFEATYRREYKDTLKGPAILVNTLRVSLVGVRPEMKLEPWAKTEGSLDDALIDSRPVYFDDGWVDTPIYDRFALPAGGAVTGPSIVQQKDSTIVIEPGSRGIVDRYGNIIVEEVR